jgi:N-methylhydantoinase A/oxoprolinase/acetone carboxylase beta subunit
VRYKVGVDVGGTFTVIREYERLSTAAVNAYIRPIMQRYLASLRKKLKAGGFQTDD